MKTFFYTLKKNNVPYVGFTFFYVVASVLLSFSIVIAIIFQSEVLQAAYYSDTSTAVNMLLILLGSFAVQILVTALRTFFSTRFSSIASYKVRNNFLAYFLGTSQKEVDKISTGEVLSLYSTDEPYTQVLLSQSVFDILNSTISFAVTLGFMMFISLTHTLILLVTSILLVGLQAISSTPIQKNARQMFERLANFNNVVSDSLQNTSTIITYSLEDLIEEKYLGAYDSYLYSLKKYAKNLAVIVSIGFISSFLPLIIINIILSQNVISGNMFISEFIAFTTLTSIATLQIGMLSQNLGNLQAMIASAKRINENTAKPLDELETGENLNNFDVSVKNLWFKHSETDILQDISFDIPQGSNVAIVGESGSGKSTLIKLILGIYEPDQGSISIGGKALTDISKNSLRKNMSYVPQGSFMFATSIGENIALSSDKIDMLETSCKEAGILEFIKELPDAFDTVLDESAANLSGGQRQRIALARAFYKDSPVMLLDEITSALDSQTEEDILQILKNKKKDKTIISIAHREKAVVDCDMIIVMDKGKIAGIGNHNELLEKNDIYKNLFENLGGKQYEQI